MSLDSGEPADAFTQALADCIRGAKDQKHFTVRSLADATGLNPSSVQRYVDGKRAIPVPALRKIAQVLGTTAGRLLDEAEDVLT